MTYDPITLGGRPGGLRIVVAVVALILTHRYNAVRGHRTCSNNSGAGDYLRGGKQIKP